MLGVTTCLTVSPGTVAWAAAMEVFQNVGVRSGESKVMYVSVVLPPAEADVVDVLEQAASRTRLAAAAVAAAVRLSMEVPFRGGMSGEASETIPARQSFT